LDDLHAMPDFAPLRLADVLRWTGSAVPEVRKRAGFTSILKQRINLWDGLPPF
jgi:hypothetical protein